MLISSDKQKNKEIKQILKKIIIKSDKIYMKFRAFSEKKSAYTKTVFY